jgi:hypothetical protein
MQKLKPIARPWISTYPKKANLACPANCFDDMCYLRKQIGSFPPAKAAAATHDECVLGPLQLLSDFSS